MADWINFTISVINFTGGCFIFWGIFQALGISDPGSSLGGAIGGKIGGILGGRNPKEERGGFGPEIARNFEKARAKQREDLAAAAAAVEKGDLDGAKKSLEDSEEINQQQAELVREMKTAVAETNTKIDIVASALSELIDELRQNHQKQEQAQIEKQSAEVEGIEQKTQAISNLLDIAEKNLKESRATTQDVQLKIREIEAKSPEGIPQKTSEKIESDIGKLEKKNTETSTVIAEAAKEAEQASTELQDVIRIVESNEHKQIKELEEKGKKVDEINDKIKKTALWLGAEVKFLNDLKENISNANNSRLFRNALGNISKYSDAIKKDERRIARCEIRTNRSMQSLLDLMDIYGDELKLNMKDFNNVSALHKTLINNLSRGGELSQMLKQLTEDSSNTHLFSSTIIEQDFKKISDIITSSINAAEGLITLLNTGLAKKVNEYIAGLRKAIKELEKIINPILR